MPHTPRAKANCSPPKCRADDGERIFTIVAEQRRRTRQTIFRAALVVRWHSVGLAGLTCASHASCSSCLASRPAARNGSSSKSAAVSPIASTRPCAASTSRGEWASELDALDIPVVVAWPRARFSAVASADVWHGSSRQHHIDVVHCHHYSPYVYGLLAAMLEARVRAGVYRARPSLGCTTRRASGASSIHCCRCWPGRLCAVSADLKQHMVAEGFPRRQRPGGLQRHRCRASARRRCSGTRREALGVPHDAFVVGTVGTTRSREEPAGCC